MKKIKTSEATELVLDWLVATCEGGTDFQSDGITWGFTLGGQTKVLAKGWAPSMSFCPSTDWAQGGPIIEREKLCPVWSDALNEWGCSKHEGKFFFGKGATFLIAAMRCFAASKLGDEVEVPEELLP